MTALLERSVLFADLRGSTGLYGRLGNAEAANLITTYVAGLAATVEPCGGRLVKTLGDGLMAVFERPTDAVIAAVDMHTRMEQAEAQTGRRGLDHSRQVHLQVVISHGEVAEVSGDYFGDAVNVAARLLDHAGDGETLITNPALTRSSPRLQGRFRHLDWLHLRGRAEPVLVHLMGGHRRDGSAATQLEVTAVMHDPDALKLSIGPKVRVHDAMQMPLVVGRSAQANYVIDDARVSRVHARLDWHGGNFHLTDLSFNGTFVRFDSGNVLALRRTRCTLHGSGSIGLGAEPGIAHVSSMGFEIIKFSGESGR